MSHHVNQNEVDRWLERLLHGKRDQDRLQAASELSRMRIRTRGVVRTRGSLSRAADSDFPESVGSATIRQALDTLQKDQSPAVRREVAAALGEWGSEYAVEILSRMAVGPTQDSDEGVRRACVRALGLIGGPDAAKSLSVAAEHDEVETVRREAIGALAELIRQEQGTRRTRTRGHRMRTRGGRPSSPLLSNMLDTLGRISTNDGEEEYLRRKAEVGLTTLTDLDRT